MNSQGFDHVDFGDLQQFLDYPDVTDVSCKNDGEVWLTSNERGHYLSDVKVYEKEVMRIASQIANKMQKEFNPANPNLEGDIQGKEEDYRVGCVHRHLSPFGTTLVIRKVRKKLFLSYSQLLRDKSISKEALHLLILAVKSGMNMIFIGETGSGKTELLKFLSQYIPKEEVVVTIEDSMEFNLNQLISDLSCTAFHLREGVTYQQIVAMSLRLNVQRILLQEARGEEVDDLLDAMSTGHTVMTTMHARSVETVCSRIKQMLKSSQESYDHLQARVYGLVDLVVFMEKEKTKKGTHRKVKQIARYQYFSKENRWECNLVYDYNKKLFPMSSDFIQKLIKGKRYD